jgi:2-polyprenyl-3-methyl-5-hydroxy-6-metoxy-1,4-benzoquinol methylase
MDLSCRSTMPERLDTDGIDLPDYRTSLRDLSRVNLVTFTAHPTLAWLKRQRLRRGDRVSLLDVGFGYGDMLRRISRWAARRGIDMELIGIDLNPRAAAVAREVTPPQQNIRYCTGDVFTFAPDQPFDFIISAQFTHHLNNADIVRFIRWMEQHARRGWLISDLRRARFAYYGFELLARALRWHNIVREDGKVSITRGFRIKELQALLREAQLDGANAQIRGHPFFRLTIERQR